MPLPALPYRQLAASLALCALATLAGAFGLHGEARHGRIDYLVSLRGPAGVTIAQGAPS